MANVGYGACLFSFRWLLFYLNQETQSINHMYLQDPQMCSSFDEGPQELSAAELLEIAGQRAEEELDQLRAELRLLSERYRVQAESLEARIRQKTRLIEKLSGGQQ